MKFRIPWRHSKDGILRHGILLVKEYNCIERSSRGGNWTSNERWRRIWSSQWEEGMAVRAGLQVSHVASWSSSTAQLSHRQLLTFQSLCAAPWLSSGRPSPGCSRASRCLSLQKQGDLGRFFMFRNYPHEKVQVNMGAAILLLHLPKTSEYIFKRKHCFLGLIGNIRPNTGFSS